MKIDTHGVSIGTMTFQLGWPWTDLDLVIGVSLQILYYTEFVHKVSIANTQSD